MKMSDDKINVMIAGVNVCIPKMCLLIELPTLENKKITGRPEVQILSFFH